MSTTKKPVESNRLCDRLKRSSNEVLSSRADRVSKRTYQEQQNLVNKLNGELMDLEDRRAQLLDLSPDSTISTKIENFDPKVLVEKYQQYSKDIALKQIEVQIAKENIKLIFDIDDKE